MEGKARFAAVQDVCSRLSRDDLQHAISHLNREARRALDGASRRTGVPWDGSSPLQQRAMRAQRAADALRQIMRLLPEQNTSA